VPNRTYYHLMLTSVLGAVSAPAWADTTVSSESTAPLQTQTAGNITVEEDASIETEHGVPVTINSGATLTVDEGGQVIANDDVGTSAVLVTTTQPFSIANAGLIQVQEDFVPQDDDGNSIPDGQIARSSGRAGIRVTSPAQGTIANDGTIRVEGLNSYGIVLQDSFVGNLTNDGTIATIGDYSKAISVQSVDGDLNLNGYVLATGEGAQAVVVNGNVSGSLTIQGAVGQQSTFVNDDSVSMSLSRGDLRVSAPAVEIGGSVDGGILIAAAPYDLDDADTDEDDDGVTDTSEVTGKIMSYGASPALHIGGSNPVTIGGVQARDGVFSLAVDGNITANATYSSISTTAVEIGGAQPTVLTDGIGVSGTVSATTYDAGATGILINQNAVVPSLTNSGSITAAISSPGDGSTIAVQDLSGTLASVDNSGTITAGGSREDVKVALDLSNAASGVTLRQYLNDIDAAAKADEEEEEDYNPASPTIYTAIYGDLLLSAHNDTINSSSGLISGRTYFGNGDDSLALSSDAIYYGDVYGGLGNLSVQLRDSSRFYGSIDAASQASTLDLFDTARYTGTFQNAENLTVNVNGGKLVAESGETAQFGTLNVASGGAIGVVIDGEEGTSSSFDVATANFASGSKVEAEITTIAGAEGDYQILTASQINGAPTFDPETNDIPLLFNADLAVNSNDIVLSIRRKSAEELGFNPAQTAAYDPIMTMLADQSTLESSLLQAESLPDLQRQFEELLPEYSGGVFEFATLASRTASARINSETRDFFDVSNVGGWISPLYLQTRFNGANGEEVKITGKGLAGALEFFHPRGTLGIDLSYTMGNMTSGNRQDAKLKLFEVGGYYRRSFGPIYTFARIAGGQVSVNSERQFTGSVDESELSYSADGEWTGLKISGLAGASAKVPVTGLFALVPAVSLDYQWLREKGYAESGDAAIALTVDSRTSKRLSALASLTASLPFSKARTDGVPLTLDLQAGRRFSFVNEAGSTVANFTDGSAFSITSPTRSGAWQGEVKLHGGEEYGTWGIIVGGEKSKDQWSATARAVLSVAF